MTVQACKVINTFKVHICVKTLKSRDKFRDNFRNSVIRDRDKFRNSVIRDRAKVKLYCVGDSFFLH